MEYIKKYLDDLKKTIVLLNEEEINSVITILEQTRDHHKTVFTMGNGGSASNASHFVNGLSQGATVEGKPRFKAISLTDNIPNMLAYGNDFGYENIFVEQLKNLLSEGDVVIGISGSGNSPNVLKAIEYAKKQNVITIGFTGFDGGKLKKMVKYSVHVPCNCMEIVEDVHLALTHLISSYYRKK
jgi:D-sedoheptulose 7-phosphate isomerase